MRLINFVVAGEHAAESGLRLLDGHFGQEAEPAKIHADDGNSLRGDQPRDAEQRAVAAEHHDQVGAIGEMMPLDGLGADLFRGLGISNRSLVLAAQKAGEGSRDFDRFGPLALDDQADRFYGALCRRHQMLIMR